MARRDQRKSAFAGRLKKAMGLKSMSAARLARETGIGESTIHRYLTGEREPIYGNLIAIARALEADLDFLTGMDGASPGGMLAELINKLAADVRRWVEIDGVSEASLDDATARAIGRIPVIGTISEGQSLEFTSDGHPHGRAVYVIPTLGDTDQFAYGIESVGDAMAPRIMERDVVVCSPEAEWASGDLVILRNSAGEMLIRVIQERRSSYLLRSYDLASNDIELPKSKVLFVHKVVSIRPKNRKLGEAVEYET